MSRLEIFLLGPPRILCDRRPVNLKRRKALGLLAYLALARRPSTRDALATFFWPQADDRRAHANLRNLLWVLRQSVVPDGLRADSARVELGPEADLWLDVTRFRELTAGSGVGEREGATIDPDRAERLAEAVELYRESFLSGFGLPDNPAFDEWQMQLEDELRAEQAAALTRLVRFAEARGEFEQAIMHARRMLTLDPLSEPAQRQLMSLFARTGQRGEALRLYEQSGRLLRERLGLSVARETTALRDRIVNGELAGSERPAPAPTPRHNLAEPATPFLGREAELAHLRGILTDPDRRLLAITGPGGSGKTRLALQAARDNRDRFAGGAWFVPLAAVERPDSIVSAVAAALPVPAALPGPNAAQQRTLLLDYLREKRLLLVLDNLEHLLAGLDLIGDILEQAPGVTLLATSRERLRLTGETTLELAGLPCPEEEAAPGAVRASGAVCLFLQGARRADATFSPSGADLRVIGGICRSLRGHPLGIELAAAWVRTLSCADIAKEIAASFDFLTSRHRDAPPRHRSLRDVFHQSWRLLASEEKKAFRRLAIFRGEFGRAAAREIGGCSLTTLSSLADKSLLRRNPSGRYEIHEALRPFAEERLAANAREQERAAERLGAHYLNRLARLDRSLTGRAQKAALDEIAGEIENVRAAWLGAAGRRQVARLSAAARSLFIFHDIRGRFGEGATLFGEAADHLDPPAGPAESHLLGLLVSAQGWFLTFSDPDRGRSLLRRGLELLEPTGEDGDVAFAGVLGVIVGAWQAGPEARVRLERYVSLAEAGADRWCRGLALEVFGYALRDEDPAEALRCAQRSLELRRRSGDAWGIALALDMLASLADAQDLPHIAKRRYRESLAHRQRLGEDPAGVVCCLGNLGRLARRTGNYPEALRLAEECRDRSRELGSRWFLVNSLILLGLISYDLGDSARARARLERALPLMERVGETAWTPRLLALLGNVALSEGDRAEACVRLEQAAARATRYRACVPGDFLTGEISPAPSANGGNGDAPDPWHSLGSGRLLADTGDPTAARAHFVRALRRFRAEREDPTSLEALVEMSRLEADCGRPERGVEWLGFALAQRVLSPRARARAEEAMAGLQGTLPGPDLDGALARGRERRFADLDEEIAALQPSDDRPAPASRTPPRTSR